MGDPILSAFAPKLPRSPRGKGSLNQDSTHCPFPEEVASPVLFILPPWGQVTGAQAAGQAHPDKFDPDAGGPEPPNAPPSELSLICLRIKKNKKRNKRNQEQKDVLCLSEAHLPMVGKEKSHRGQPLAACGHTHHTRTFATVKKQTVNRTGRSNVFLFKFIDWQVFFLSVSSFKKMEKKNTLFKKRKCHWI